MNPHMALIYQLSSLNLAAGRPPASGMPPMMQPGQFQPGPLPLPLQPIPRMVTPDSKTVKIRGLPFRATPLDILSFFDGFQFIAESLQTGPLRIRTPPRAAAAAPTGASPGRNPDSLRPYCRALHQVRPPTRPIPSLDAPAPHRSLAAVAPACITRHIPQCGRCRAAIAAPWRGRCCTHPSRCTDAPQLAGGPQAGANCAIVDACRARRPAPPPGPPENAAGSQGRVRRRCHQARLRW
jgi:hypothetical protein